MNRRLTAIVECESDGYIAFCPEVDVVSQGDTVTEARENLAEALTLFLRVHLSMRSTDGCLLA